MITAVYIIKKKKIKTSLGICFGQDQLGEKFGQLGLAIFSEGHIGKLQFLKSGRTRLVLGNNNLDVTLGTPSGFLQVFMYTFS